MTLMSTELTRYYQRAVRHGFGDRLGTPGLVFPTYQQVNGPRDLLRDRPYGALRAYWARQHQATWNPAADLDTPKARRAPPSATAATTTAYTVTGPGVVVTGDDETEEDDEYVDNAQDTAAPSTDTRARPASAASPRRGVRVRVNHRHRCRVSTWSASGGMFGGTRRSTARGGTW